MSKLNHHRPQLVYLDNLRRELSGGTVPKPPRSPRRKTRMEAHIEATTAMLAEQKEVIWSLIERYAAYVAALGADMSHLAEGKGRKNTSRAREEAYVNLVSSGTRFLEQTLDDAKAGRPCVHEWLDRFFKLISKADRRHWSDLHDILIEDCIPHIERTLPTDESA